ncbi:MAG TPA: hypothetical protein PK619_03845 [bacterium]|nr:hypothetical protein [bacterium]HPW39811.1 hypothetical protein [bacterium]
MGRGKKIQEFKILSLYGSGVDYFVEDKNGILYKLERMSYRDAPKFKEALRKAKPDLAIQ